MTATPLSLTGPDNIAEAVPYLLGFTPTNSLVLVALRDTHLTVTARVDLDTHDDPSSLADLMTTLAIRAESTHVIAITYGQRTEPAAIAATAAAAGLRLVGHLRVDAGRYWSLTCPIEGCCPTEGRALPHRGSPATHRAHRGGRVRRHRSKHRRLPRRARRESRSRPPERSASTR